MEYKIRDSSGFVLGTIISGSTTEVAYDTGGRQLTIYYKNTNETRDNGGRFVAQGNVLSSYIYKK